ncbi:2-dehydropantoate 2-reductase [Streptomyces tateyamensis]|uniref:2-dehydropantoate 2-reductase n=1 Tax=Streptomyces tateyamensis TaxID=565073 RepID=A0A2V4NHY3_9ACTN|nr:2-dehydropantoate 2-reductase [Streptomyces tateyamensis]
MAVLGAGSIGCHLGGLLADTAEVVLIGRPGAMAAIEADGLTLTGPGEARRVTHRLTLATGAEAAAGADYVLVTVKSTDTAAAAAQLAPHLSPGTVVISFQNGLHNPALLRAALPDHPVLAGMVPYNVVRTGPAAFHQGSGGRVLLADAPDAAGFLAAAAGTGLRVAAHPDMPGVQAAKLVMNLNNAINALSDLPLREQLGRRAYRVCLARCQREALAAFRAAGIRPVQLGAVPPARMPLLLGLPDPLFRRLAGAALRIDAKARSSMWEDLQRGRPTEVDSLQGEVVALAERHGLRAPACARLVELVHQAERAGAGAARPWSGPELRAELG